MYWSRNLGHGADLEGIFEKGVHGLKELLDLDCVILKAKNGDEKLLTYLTQEVVLRRLLHYCTGAGLLGELALRLPLVACELLCTEQPVMLTALVRNSPILREVWVEEIDVRPPLFACWARLTNYLLGKFPGPLAESFMARPDFLRDHLHLLAFPEFREGLLRLVSIAQLDGVSKSQNPIVLNWLVNDFGLFETLFSWMADDESDEPDRPSIAFNFLVDMTNFPFDEQYPVEALFDTLVDNLSRSLNDIFEASVIPKASFTLHVNLAATVMLKIAENRTQHRWRGIYERLVASLRPHLGRINEILAPRTRPLPFIQTPAGVVNPLGIVRLMAAKLCAHLVRLEEASIAHLIEEQGIFNSLLVASFLSDLMRITVGTLLFASPE